jgi:positive regulator of sigma E activity
MKTKFSRTFSIRLLEKKRKAKCSACSELKGCWKESLPSFVAQKFEFSEQNKKQLGGKDVRLNLLHPAYSINSFWLCLFNLVCSL